MNELHMGVNDPLQEAYKEWRRLAETEGEAIRSGNWPMVEACQKALQQLQPVILRHTQAVQSEWKRSRVNRPEKENQVREAIADLIRLESRNNALLQSVRQAARAQIERLEQTGRVLRQVQRFYAPSRPAAWTSFS